MTGPHDHNPTMQCVTEVKWRLIHYSLFVCQSLTLNNLRLSLSVSTCWTITVTTHSYIYYTVYYTCNQQRTGSIHTLIFTLQQSPDQVTTILKVKTCLSHTHTHLTAAFRSHHSACNFQFLSCKHLCQDSRRNYDSFSSLINLTIIFFIIWFRKFWFFFSFVWR